MGTNFQTKGLFWVGGILILFVCAVALHGELSLSTALVLMAVCFCCELIDSGLGMGYGTILTPMLLLLGYTPFEIVPTILLSELLTGFTAAFFHHQVSNVDLSRKSPDLKAASILAGGSVSGVVAGVLLALALPVKTLSVLIGCIICFSGASVLILSRHRLRYQTWKMLLLSVIASFNKAISGGGYGPLLTSGQILSGIRTRASIGITSFAEAFTCLLTVSLFLISGGHVNTIIFIPMCTGALMSVPFAVFAVNRTKERYLQKIIGVLTLCMGTLTIIKALA